MSSELLHIDSWLIDVTTGDTWSYTTGDTTVASPSFRLDPKSIDIIKALSAKAGDVITKDALIEAAWPNTIVTDDALARSISRLRKSLNDDAKAPRIIETVPKRGYRLIASINPYSAQNQQQEPLSHQQKKSGNSDKPDKRNPRFRNLLLASVATIMVVTFWVWHPLSSEIEQEASLIQQADDYYLQMRRQDNEMAIALYEQSIALRPNSGEGQAGLANALVQQVIRWPNLANMPDIPHKNLQQAIDDGRTSTKEAKHKLDRALAFAEQAVNLAPDSARAHKAIGFVYSAQQRFDDAIKSYQRAVALDSNAWDALINIADVIEISQRNENPIDYYEAAFEAMTRVYDAQTSRIQPWYADLGAIIGDKHLARGQQQEAETWYRHVLSFAPLNNNATKGLANILTESGDHQSAERLCLAFEQKVGTQPCQL